MLTGGDRSWVLGITQSRGDSRYVTHNNPDLYTLASSHRSADANVATPGNYVEAVAAEATYNALRYTEDLTWSYYAVLSQLTKTGDVALVEVEPGVFVLLHRLVGTTFNAGLDMRYASASLTPFVAGQRYLLSYYVYSTNEQWFWMRLLTNTTVGAHGVRCSPGMRVVRVQQVVQATSTTALDTGNTATNALGASGSSTPAWIQTGGQAALDLYVGGLQLEPIDSDFVDGIAILGDSTHQGSAAANDYARDFTDPDNRQISTVLSAELSCTVFNRAEGGYRLDQLDSEYATRITPLAQRCWAVILQGGINDIGQGTRTLADMQTSIQSMIAKAQADGLVPILQTVTPFDDIETAGAKRTLYDQYNEWLTETYGNSSDVLLVDANHLVQSPWNEYAIHPAGYRDGIHYSGEIKTQVGKYFAEKIRERYPDQLISPSRYVRKDNRQSAAGVGYALVANTSRSGTITAGGTAQTLASANAARRGFFFQNHSDTDMWIRETGTAAATQPSIKVAAGTIFSLWTSGAPTTAISLFCATTGKEFTAREW